MFNKLLVLLLLLPALACAETIDSFAKNALAPAPAAIPGGLPPLPSQAPPPPVVNSGTALPGKNGSSQVFDVVFIQGNGKVRKAYLVVDGRYGKMVREGDVVQSWKVVAVGDDYVDVAHAGKRKRLLMDAGAASGPEQR
ncbi:hypothetical protein KIF53_13930 [Chromobacterium subtsugae]|uniref:Pilus assembly protein PilP n=1 Tax=Chromobacterium subtsugae TaxID=251747 RepID=A0ABS7FGZ3_9NEIS|nr:MULTISPECIES: hypothetical protein [Chromobacterium]KUM05603.1 hypothetical protein Cv017_08305 [Chromobacterium subtsugae]KZE87673.1 hypothetical protein AWB61_10845 [Chromobacterium sp. F49]MBW7566951.1 hypothetical protein [Chromobacterium subtsugae]MBW8288730.1 hypothetical protein [Chromobacterium subtsugae]OBU85744.1 hypothetical protein MY55_14195 [Chromobacterium subtsugae]